MDTIMVFALNLVKSVLVNNRRMPNVQICELRGFRCMFKKYHMWKISAKFNKKKKLIARN